MKNIKTLYITAILCCTALLSFSQVRVVNSTTNSSAANSSAFIDASSNGTVNSSTNIGKGFLFPQTDLTTFASFSGFPTGLPNSYPTHFDGMVVYNTATGTSSIGSVAVTPGFYYYSNPGASSPSTGTWTPVGNGGTPAIPVVDDTPAETGVIINGSPEKVIRLSGTADGVTTHLDLGTTVLAANTVSVFRKAIVFDSTSGNVLTQSTGAYDTATNKFMTSTGLMNHLLPEGTYDVEVYYTE